MRILSYRQKLDSYKTVSERLRLVEINISDPKDLLPTDAPAQTERFAALVMANPKANPGLTQLRLAKSDGCYKFFCNLLNQDHAMRLSTIELKARCLELGFRLCYVHPCDNEEIDDFHVKVPFGSTNGYLKFTIGPFAKTEEIYEISWQNGILSTIQECIKDESRLYTNIGNPNGDINAEFSTFKVEEITR